MRMTWFITSPAIRSMMMVRIWAALNLSSFMFLSMMMSLTVVSNKVGMSSFSDSFFKPSDRASEE